MMQSILRAFLPQPKVRSLAALQQFLDSEAAHLAQRTAINFIRNELGNRSPHALDDPRYQAKIAVSRWEGFAQVLADMIVLTKACLEAPGTPRAILDRRLGDLYAAILGAHPVPEHRAQGWEAEISALRARLAAHEHAPVDPQGYGEKTGSLVFDTLPFRPRDPVENRMVLCNAFAFGLIAFNERLRRLLTASAVRDELVASGP
ncbi:MAG TPA: hypothetical protein VLA02_02100 [Reyranella sp.]|nr:hypothetical protein [Reyranella sp.]